MEPVPKRRDLARDKLTDRIGEVMWTRPVTPAGRRRTTLYWLRPVGGGIEWTRYAEAVELLTPEDPA